MRHCLLNASTSIGHSISPTLHSALLANTAAPGPLFWKGGKGHLQAAATAAAPTEQLHRIKDRLTALEAAYIHALNRCDGAEERG
jgi:hypothetical protein